MLHLWLVLFVGTGLIAGVWTGYFKARKIQPNGFKWRIFRNEILIAAVTMVIAGPAIAYANHWLTARGVIRFRSGPASWWMIALEYAAYFFGFDTWFYWLHRWMHNEPVYSWVHKLHHRSTSPNLLTTLSVHPFESVINGGFMTLFLCLVSVHPAALALIAPTNIFMGLYVHSGYEFLPRWWNRSWLSKWFITATFHDQHHKYFTANFGGYTTIWDYICGTARAKYPTDFEKIKARPIRSRAAAAQGVSASTEGRVAAAGADA